MKVSAMKGPNFILETPAGRDTNVLTTGSNLETNTAHPPHLANQTSPCCMSRFRIRRYFPYFSTKGRPPIIPTHHASADPTAQPTAPASATNRRLNGCMGGVWLLATMATVNAPEKGIMTSLGRGIHALSIAIRAIMPGYPNVLMTCIIHSAIISVMLCNVVSFRRRANQSWCFFCTAGYRLFRSSRTAS